MSLSKIIPNAEYKGGKEKAEIVIDGVSYPGVVTHHRTCELNTSYYGCTLSLVMVFVTPLGRVERNYWASGPGLERSGVEWRIIPNSEVAEAQNAFASAVKAFNEAKARLIKLGEKPVGSF